MGKAQAALCHSITCIFNESSLVVDVRELLAIKSQYLFGTKFHFCIVSRASSLAPSPTFTLKVDSP